ncbi:MAG: ATP synthase F0 subunit B [Caldilineales bacterium]|nr:ATP synthase F0 subunit B [Caldilineales bacterium]MDW8318113.1 ATP synthase F0 subunit B [Anaerolineae bacterium]
MDLQQLINQLEAVLNDGRRVPFSDRLLIDEEACRSVIDQMRVSVPEVIRQAERLLGERDRIIAQAKEEANRILQMAREQASELVDQHHLVAEAQQRVDRMLAKAEQEAAAMRVEADNYALNTLKTLAKELERIQREVNNGIQALSTGRPTAH